MKKRLLTMLVFVCTLVFGLAVLAACGGNGGVTLSQEEVSLGVGDTTNVVASADDGSEITWTSSDESIVTITAQNAKRGRATIRGEKSGTVILTASSARGGRANCTVTVKNYVIQLSDTQLTLNRKASDLSYESKTITATVLCDGERIDEKISWASDNEECVTVANGVLTAHRITEEPVTITAKRAGGNASATCAVSVEWDNAPEGWYQIPEDGSGYAIANAGKWSWYGFQGTDDVHPNVYGEGFAEGKATFIVSGNTGWRWYGAQIFYKSPGLTEGSVYKLTMKLKSDTAGWITVNETDVQVPVGETTVEIVYREGETSVSMNLAVHDKIHNSVNPSTEGSSSNNKQYREGTLEVLEMKWAPYSATKLQTPTFSIAADKKMTFTYPNETDVFEGYVIGFFKDGDEDDDPSYTLPVMKGDGDDILSEKDGRDFVKDLKDEEGKTYHEIYLDDSFVPGGDYKIRVRAYCGTPALADSDWSAPQDWKVAEKSEVEYKVLQSYRDVDRGIGRYFVWSEWNQYDLSGCSFKGDDLTLTLTGEASWYSNQVFYTAKEITPTGTDENGNVVIVPKVYEMTFTLSAKTVPASEGDPSTSLDLTGRKFVVAGQILDAKDGGTYTVRFLSSGSVTMFLGQPTGESWDETVADGGLPKGIYTFQDIKFEDATDPSLSSHNVWFFGDTVGTAQSDDGKDKLMYWYSPVGDWAEWNATIDMRSMSYETNTASDTGYSYHFNYKITPIENKVCLWIFRLWYMKSGLDTGKEYYVDLLINASEAGVILVDDQEVHLEVGEHPYRVYLRSVSTPLFISMATSYSMTGTSENGMDLTIKSIKWTQGSKASLTAPTGTVGEDGTITFTDSQEGVDHYEIGLFDKESGARFSTQIIKSGDKIDPAQHMNGEYDVKLRACGDVDHADSDWVKIGEFTITNGAGRASKLDHDADETGPADHAKDHPGVWYHWLDHQDWENSTATIEKNIWSGNSFTFGYKTTGWPNLGYSVQLYFKNIGNTNRLYAFKANMKLSVDGTITVNGKPVTLKANVETPVRVAYNEGDLSISIQMGVYHAGAPVMNGEITISDWQWEEVSSQAVKTPTNFALAEDGTVTFTDPNNGVNVNGFRVAFFKNNVEMQSYAVASGDKIPFNTLYRGDYEVKVKAVGDGPEYTDSGWSNAVTKKIESTSEYPAYDMTNTEEAKTPFYTMVYWAETKNVTTARFENGTVTYTLSGPSNNWYSNQIFYKFGNNEGGYTLTLKVHSTTTGTIRINGKNVELTAGQTTDVTVTDVLGLSIQMAPVDGTQIGAGTYTFSDFTWTKGNTVYKLNGPQA